MQKCRVLKIALKGGGNSLPVGTGKLNLSNKILDVGSLTIFKVTLYHPFVIQLSDRICLAACSKMFLFILVCLNQICNT